MNSTKVASCAFIFLLILWSESLYKEPLYAYTLTYTPTIQADATSLDRFLWLAFSDLALVGVLAGPFFYELMWKGNLAAVVYKAIVVATITVFVNFFKLYYHDPRPFWSADAVQAF